MAISGFVTTVRRWSAAPWFLASGVLLVLTGLIGGLMTKQSADIASVSASQPTRMVGGQILSPTQMTGPRFVPSSAHYVAPDYTVFGIGVLVIVLGLTILMVSVGTGLAERRRAA